MEPAIIRIGLFGDQASGKTSLLSSFFGAQQHYAFEKDHGYRIVAVNTTDGNKLLQNYYRMENGDFPQGTVSRIHPYLFDFKISGLAQTALRIEWIDYPGGWWSQEPNGDEEKTSKQTCIQALLKADLCVLCVDGERYADKNQRQSYLKLLFDQFRNEILSWQEKAKQDGIPLFHTEKEWIVALTKCDLVIKTDDTFTCEKFAKELIANYNEYQEGLSKAVQGMPATDTTGLGRQGFGSRYILLSAAEGVGTTVLNVTKTIGLNYIVPATLATFLERLAKAKDKNLPKLSVWQRIILAATDIVRNKEVEKELEKVEKELDKKDMVNRGIVAVAKILLHVIGPTSKESVDEYKAQFEMAKREGEALKALVAVFAGLLTAEEAKKTYFIAQF